MTNKLVLLLKRQTKDKHIKVNLKLYLPTITFQKV